MEEVGQEPHGEPDKDCLAEDGDQVAPGPVVAVEERGADDRSPVLRELAQQAPQQPRARGSSGRG